MQEYFYEKENDRGSLFLSGDETAKNWAKENRARVFRKAQFEDKIRSPYLLIWEGPPWV